MIHGQAAASYNYTQGTLHHTFPWRSVAYSETTLPSASSLARGLALPLCTHYCWTQLVLPCLLCNAAGAALCSRTGRACRRA